MSLYRYERKCELYSYKKKKYQCIVGWQLNERRGKKNKKKNQEKRKKERKKKEKKDNYK